MRKQLLRLRATIATLCVLGWLLVGVPRIAFAAKPHPARSHEYKREVEKLEEQWRIAQLNGDVAAMDKLLSDDYVGISVNGMVNTKAQQLERMSSRKLVLTRIQQGEMKVKLVGQVAIVTSSAEVEGTNDDVPLKGMYRYMRVYQRTPGAGWKITSFEATRMSAAQERKAEADMNTPSPLPQ